MNSSPQILTKPRRTLLLILAVFALPLALAWVFTLGPVEWRPVGSVNNGVLLTPALSLKSYGVTDSAGAPLNLDAVAGDWFLVVLSDSRCMETCQHWIKVAEQIQIAVGRDMDRVEIAVLGPVEAGVPRSGLNWLMRSGGELAEALNAAARQPVGDSVLLIVDYAGYVVLMYPPDEPGPGALKDLKRLLKATVRG
jgi:cytochrome oxidase Cu insertion factor (SCO1/SenC/PrrC family)